MYPTTDERAAPGISISPFLAYDDSMMSMTSPPVITNSAVGTDDDADAVDPTVDTNRR